MELDTLDEYLLNDNSKPVSPDPRKVEKLEPLYGFPSD